MLKTERADLAVKQFQKSAEATFTAYCMANYGMSRISNELLRDPNINQSAPFVIGPEDPAHSPPVSSIPTSIAVEAMQDDGAFSSIIANGLVCWLYSLWEDEFRYTISVAEACAKNDVQCKLMNDVRIIRHWILHDKSVANEKGIKKLSILKWPAETGEFVIRHAEMQELQMAINGMQVHLKASSAKKALNQQKFRG